LHVIAGVPGLVHDLAPFKSTATELEELVASKPNEPTKFLADKGYIGFTDPANHDSLQEIMEWRSEPGTTGGK
jgi:hypothetical protein